MTASTPRSRLDRFRTPGMAVLSNQRARTVGVPPAIAGKVVEVGHDVVYVWWPLLQVTRPMDPFEIDSAPA